MSGTIFVSPGSHQSIGLEVFFKALCCLNFHDAQKFCLVGSKELIKEHLSQLKLNYNFRGEDLSIYGNNINFIDINEPDPIKSPQVSLDHILNIITSEDILLTLPMGKEELYFEGKLCSGHTEYFRNFFKKDSLTMFFKSHQDYHLLLTDHVSLSNVSSKLNKSDIKKKVKDTFDYMNEELDEIIFSGLNPHAGENGTLGDEENKILIPAVKSLMKLLPRIGILGPLPSDTIHQHRNLKKIQLFVYCYHDQSLNVFKERNRWLGSNITIGLPFKRLSVDHGTARALVWKNSASYQGALFTMKECLSLLAKKGLSNEK